MHRLSLVAAVLLMFAFPPSGLAADGGSVAPGIMRSGIAAVARLSDTSQNSAVAAQSQQGQLYNDKKTTIIVVSVVAVATVIWINYQLHHAGGGLTGHF
jgi:hypothetical protein